MNRKKIMYLGMAGIMMGSLLTGCGSEEENSSQTSNVSSVSTGSGPAASGSQTASGEKTKVGFIVQDLTINYFLNVVRGVEDMQDQYNMEVQVIDGQSDATTQVLSLIHIFFLCKK